MLYFAYGSNLSKSAMRARAPRAKPIMIGMLPRHLLVFESNEPVGQPDAFFANVRECPNESVPGALYEVDADDLKSLDTYEDVARGVYERILTGVAGADGTRMEAIVYRMRAAGAPRIGSPSDAQLEQIRAGYADWGLDLAVLGAALESASAKIS